MLPLEVYPALVLGPRSPAPGHAMPCCARSCFNWRFSSAMASLSRETVLKFSFSRKTSCSSALIYSSFRSRCVLIDCQSLVTRWYRTASPLCLSVQLLPSGESGFAVWLGTPSFRWLAIGWEGLVPVKSSPAAQAYHECSSSRSVSSGSPGSSKEGSSHCLTFHYHRHSRRRHPSWDHSDRPGTRKTCRIESAMQV
jgi:hypothetical protein